MTKKPKLYWNEWDNGWTKRNFSGECVGMIRRNATPDGYGAFVRIGTARVAKDAKRVVEKHLGMERGR